MRFFFIIQGSGRIVNGLGRSLPVPGEICGGISCVVGFRALRDFVLCEISCGAGFAFFGWERFAGFGGRAVLQLKNGAIFAGVFRFRQDERNMAFSSRDLCSDS